jgi:hypothetical protein
MLISFWLECKKPPAGKLVPGVLLSVKVVGRFLYRYSNVRPGRVSAAAATTGLDIAVESDEHKIFQI